MEPRFVHLHVHSEYSLVDGLADIKSLVRATARAGMAAVAVTDRSALFSMVRFYKAAVAEGVKPVIGVDCWLRNPADPAPHEAFMGFYKFTEDLLKSLNDGQHGQG